MDPSISIIDKENVVSEIPVATPTDAIKQRRPLSCLKRGSLGPPQRAVFSTDATAADAASNETVSPKAPTVTNGSPPFSNPAQVPISALATSKPTEEVTAPSTHLPEFPLRRGLSPKKELTTVLEEDGYEDMQLTNVVQAGEISPETRGADRPSSFSSPSSIDDEPAFDAGSRATALSTPAATVGPPRAPPSGAVETPGLSRATGLMATTPSVFSTLKQRGAGLLDADAARESVFKEPAPAYRRSSIQAGHEMLPQDTPAREMSSSSSSGSHNNLVSARNDSGPIVRTNSRLARDSPLVGPAGSRRWARYSYGQWATVHQAGGYWSWWEQQSLSGIVA